MDFIRRHGATIALAILSLAKFAIEESQKQGRYDRATENYYKKKEKQQEASEQKSKKYKGTIN